MATDIVPELLELIQRDFSKEFAKSSKLKRIRKLIDEGTATYEQANQYAIEVGEILSRAYGKHITTEVLPDGRMYFNIADRIITPTLTNNHELVASVSAEIQEQINKSVGLGLKGIEPRVNHDRIKGFVDRLASEELFADVMWILGEPIVNFTQTVVDETIKANVDFQGESGLSPKIIRTTDSAKACDWCKRQAGTYEYPNVPQDVYKRHDRCRCTVEYVPDGVSKQNVWSKEWR